ncbi:hypothetical protein [Devosia ginsengisoli]|uniref:Uncharacterized protein n=1 Tax=Devosia ginsengisoli TaxID=400770 RepID=A0A5B8LXW6_9HYPH|nr:hypothetical protein [Devosia ginsengisoli]QDZ12250.1 hypothetical protein FPZ08_16745 [Devosia ginsengisoli]
MKVLLLGNLFKIAGTLGAGRHSGVALMAFSPKNAPLERFCRLAAGEKRHNIATDIAPKSS